MKTGDPMYTVETLCGKEPALTLSCVEAQLSFLRDKAVAITNAAFSDVVQREAVKSLIEDAFAERLRLFQTLAYPTFVDATAGTA
jgi:hypothetical protein